MSPSPSFGSMLTYHFYRTSSQKPGDELLANFRQQFPEVAAVSTSAAAPVISQTVGADNTTLAPTVPLPERYVMVP